MLQVDIPTRSELESLLQVRANCCVSIYVQTTPLTQAAQADRIELKNLMKQAVLQLEEMEGGRSAIGSIQAGIDDLIEDDEFWAHQSNTLAVLATPDQVRTYRLPNRLENMVEVSDRFHIKPLLRAVTVPHNAFLLVLAESGVRLVEISADLPHEVQVPGMPKAVSKSGDRSGLSDRARAGKYARAVDAAIRPILAGHHRSLILAAAEPLVSVFPGVCTYSHLAGEVIRGNTESMRDEELVAAARKVLDGIHSAEIQSLAQKFAALAGQGLATSDLPAAARAATYGAIDTLIVDMNARVPGTVDDVGGITVSDDSSASSYGVVDEITRRAMASGARVISGRTSDVPGGGALAAILRYRV